MGGPRRHRRPDRARTTTEAGRRELPGPARQTEQELARQLRAGIEAVTGLRLPVSSGPKEPRPGDIHLRLTDDAGLGAEGYRFDSADAIRIEAASTHGLFYGTRTLLQTLRADSSHRAVPRARSTDVPTQQVRMVQLDAGRKYWEMDYLENLIRRMGDMKLNTLFLHQSDSEGFRLSSPKFPGLADREHSYTRADIERLKALAARHHVQVMPGIDVPGHATVISEAFGIGFGTEPDPCTGAHTHSHLTPDWIIDITDRRAIRKTKEIVAEFSGWFDAPLFSVGADELPGQLEQCPRVQRHLAGDPGVSTLGDLLNRYINDLDDVVTAHGKRTAIYNGSEHMEAPQQRVHSSVVFLTWEGTGSEPVIPGHDEIAIGPFYVTPNNYHNLYPDEPWMYARWVPNTAPDMLGSGLTNWADYNFWAEDAYFEQKMAAPRALLADRT
ncbi:family 20 glycosylhydrolase [Streptomyces sp. WAC 06738]|uniref:family 20 glycosylhydrolase n=1 Tax=Streptomyces sp. WAC 06738 TaxID=2203210 RepID=UPI001F0CD779|nr:family 20 glycosylhydrolase [Streptomyces sp. WAC 06738]